METKKSDNQKTPLFEIHQSLGARMTPFAGWDMPVQYEGILPEHEWTRHEASIFDTCHMGEFDLRGPGAETDLERLLTLRVATIKEGQCRYGFMLNERGGVIDDLTCYRRGPEHFTLVVNAGYSGRRSGLDSIPCVGRHAIYGSIANARKTGCTRAKIPASIWRKSSDKLCRPGLFLL